MLTKFFNILFIYLFAVYIRFTRFTKTKYSIGDPVKPACPGLQKSKVNANLIQPNIEALKYGVYRVYKDNTPCIHLPSYSLGQLFCTISKSGLFLRKKQCKNTI
jgi:hypothetical protein